MAEYIDREVAYDDFEKCNGENPKWTPSRVKALIARQKAADVAPVRHGRWNVEWDAERDQKRLFERIVCSNCGLKTGQKSNYCPNCGAKMDLEEA